MNAGFGGGFVVAEEVVATGGEHGDADAFRSVGDVGDGFAGEGVEGQRVDHFLIAGDDEFLRVAGDGGRTDDGLGEFEFGESAAVNGGDLPEFLVIGGGR